MNQQKRVLIAGAGITGIATSLFCHRNGLVPEVHEASHFIGGILRDWEINNDWFFRNCQYLSPEETCFQLLPANKFLVSSCLWFLYGSLGECLH